MWLLMIDKIKAAQMKDERLSKIRGELGLGKALGFMFGDDCVLRFGYRLYVPDVDDLRKMVITKAHHTTYIMHLGANKM